MIIDIRDEKKEKITDIKFDDSTDVIQIEDDALYVKKNVSTDCPCIVKWEDLDDFIKACYKAKELAGK